MRIHHLRKYKLNNFLLFFYRVVSAFHQDGYRDPRVSDHHFFFSFTLPRQKIINSFHFGHHSHNKLIVLHSLSLSCLIILFLLDFFYSSYYFECLKKFLTLFLVKKRKLFHLTARNGILSTTMLCKL